MIASDFLIFHIYTFVLLSFTFSHDFVHNRPSKASVYYSLLASTSDSIYKPTVYIKDDLLWRERPSCRRICNLYVEHDRVNNKRTCLSDKSKDAAISIRLGLQRYLLKWNSFSNSNNCVFVYAVRSLLGPPFSANKNKRTKIHKNTTWLVVSILWLVLAIYNFDVRTIDS